jgi:hypothetical protein
VEDQNSLSIKRRPTKFLEILYLSYNSTCTDLSNTQPTMSKSVISRTVLQIQYSSELSIDEVLRRLDKAINRSEGERHNIVDLLLTSSDAKEMETHVSAVIGETFGCIYFPLYIIRTHKRTKLTSHTQ